MHYFYMGNLILYTKFLPKTFIRSLRWKMNMRVGHTPFYHKKNAPYQQWRNDNNSTKYAYHRIKKSISYVSHHCLQKKSKSENIYELFKTFLASKIPSYNTSSLEKHLQKCFSFRCFACLKMQTVCSNFWKKYLKLNSVTDWTWMTASLV